MIDKVKILVADNELPVALTMVYLLTQAGCEAEAATTNEKALRLAQAEAFNLIILDLEMPGSSGFCLLKRLRQIPHLAETPVILASGNAAIEHQQYAFALGVVDYISKPFEVTDFIYRVISHAKSATVTT